MAEVKSIHYYRLLKTATSIAYIALLVLTWRFFAGELYWRIGIAAAVLNFCWLIVTSLQINHLLKTYFDILSRLEITIPITLGVLLSIISLHSAIHQEVRFVAVAELGAWAIVYGAYRANRKKFVKQGHGPMPIGTWVSPPAKVLLPGDLLLTSGRVAANLHECVGHAELAIKMTDGRMDAFSSYMTKGIVLNPLAAVASATLRDGHYIVLRLAKPMTEEQVRKAAQVASQMQKENMAWRDMVNQRIKKGLNLLPLSSALQARLYDYLKQTGYDYVGLFMGRLTQDHWTCIAACLELYKRVGITTRPYGTGLLGLGSTIFDPIMPVRFLDDPAFELLTKTYEENSNNAVANG